ncbi:MAG TPA: hypothetical protein VJ792_00215 [Candidatus Nitrosotalea sp.]|nr:hypothetical protein [Candidatus Nitrosotalea sp.]
MSSEKDNGKRVSLRTQMVLAVIPSFVSQIIAFYRIRKLAYGIIIEVAVFFIDMVIQLVISWPAGMMIALPLTVGIPVYYVRKWTLEYNGKPQGLF